jgi:hypothetical protein
MAKKLFYILALAVIIFPSLVLVAHAYTTPTIPYWATNGLISCTGNGANGTNTCSSLGDLVDTAINIIYFGITIALLVIMPIMFAWGGLMYMFSRGKPEGISKATGILTGALIGLLIVLCAWLIINTFANVLGIQNYIGGFGA